MKLLLFYAHSFSYKTAAKSLSTVPDVEKKESILNGVVIFFHVEAEDVEKRSKVIQKFVKNTKWKCGFSKGILDEVVTRLERTDYQVLVTPFGYFNEFDIHVAGDSLAKVFKEF